MRQNCVNRREWCLTYAAMAEVNIRLGHARWLTWPGEETVLKESAIERLQSVTVADGGSSDGFHLTWLFIAIIEALKCLPLKYVAWSILIMCFEVLPVLLFKTDLNRQMAKNKFLPAKMPTLVCLSEMVVGSCAIPVPLTSNEGYFVW